MKYKDLKELLERLEDICYVSELEDSEVEIDEREKYIVLEVTNKEFSIGIKKEKENE